jgi:hypothetical protein
MELKFYLWDNNAESGPYTLGQIRSIYASGRITLDTLLREESDTEWKELRAHYIIENSQVTKPQGQKSPKLDFIFGKVAAAIGVLVGLYCVANGLIIGIAAKNAVNQTTAEILFVGGWLIIICSVICFLLARIGQDR